MTYSPTLSPEILSDLVQRIVEAVHPRRTVLFGSAARGQMGTHSDADLLVIMPDGIHRRQTAQRLYRARVGMGVAKDIVVVTESDVRQFSDEPSLVIRSALKEGRELYMPPESRIPGSPRDWLLRARSDLALAKAPPPSGVLYEDLCFHAQQAAEKAIKSAYRAAGLEFRYTHDLTELLARSSACVAES